MSDRERTFDITVRADGVSVTERKVIQDNEGELEQAIKEVLHDARMQAPGRQLKRLRLDVDELF